MKLNNVHEFLFARFYKERGHFLQIKGMFEPFELKMHFVMNEC